MRNRQMGKTKTTLCAKLGIDMETFDAYIDTINNEENGKKDKE